MDDVLRGRIFTTGDIATILSISRQTVIRNAERGMLECFFLPPSYRVRRITYKSLIEFAEKYGLTEQVTDYFGCSAEDL